MSTTHGFVAVAVTRDEARVWVSGVESGTKPESIHAPSDVEHAHVRESQRHRGHDTNHTNTAFYEAIAQSVAGANEILLIGHGKGKANEMLKLVQYWERKHPSVAQKVVGAVDSNLDALTNNEILRLVRDWFDEYHDFV